MRTRARTRVEAHLRSCTRCADEVRRAEGHSRDPRGVAPARGRARLPAGLRRAAVSPHRCRSGASSGALRLGASLRQSVLVLAVGLRPSRSPEVRGRAGREMEIRIGWSEAGPVAATQAGRGGGVAIGSGDPGCRVVGKQMQILCVVRRSRSAPQSRRMSVPVPRGASTFPSGRTSRGGIDDEGLTQRAPADPRELNYARQDAFDARVQQVEQQIASQRQADLVEMQRAFGEFEVTGEPIVVRRRELLDYLDAGSRRGNGRARDSVTGMCGLARPRLLGIPDMTAGVAATP